VTPPAGGSLVWLTLPPGVDPERLREAALAAGIAYNSGSAFSLDGAPSGGIGLAFACLEPERILEGVRTLAQLVTRARTPERERRARRSGRTAA
jgi:DNA-binding transcriptional MocR family regulator